MDDSFVILAAWRRTDPRLSVVDRLGDTYAEAAVSVTITSLTNFISFWIGAITPFPSVRIFCIYTATAVLFTYIYQVTFFGGCMAISGICEQKSLHAMFCVPVTPKSLAGNRNSCYRLFCTGGKNLNDPSNPLDNREHCLMVFFRDHMGSFLSKRSVKVLVVVCFMCYLAVGIWGCMQVREGLERHKLSRSDSYSVTFYEREDMFFRKYAYRIQVVVNATLNYADPMVQEQIESMLQKFESSPYVAGPALTESWLRAFNRFTDDGRTSFLLQSFNKTDPNDFMHILDVFFNYPLLQIFKQDVQFNDDKSEIVGTRYVIQAYNITDANKEKDMVLELRKIADSQPFPVTVFQQYFIYFDQFILVRDTSIQSICVAVAVMIAISLVFIPSFHCAIFVAFSIISIEVGVIGYMTLWGVNLDSISMINLIMCIGFSVDYSAHISYAYFSAEKRTPDDGIRAALHSLGLPIFQGSVSTILGVIALVFAPSYIFLTFFKTVFLVILFGALHGILLLPVLLSLSDSCFNSKLCTICRRFKHECLCVTTPTLSSEKPPLTMIGGPETNHFGTTGASGIGPIRIPPSGGLMLPVNSANNNILDVAKEMTSKGSKVEDVWNTENGDKDLGLGTSGESSDGSWKCPNEDRERAIIPPTQHLQSSEQNIHVQNSNSVQYLTRGMEDHVNPAYVPDDEVQPVHHHAYHHHRPPLAIPRLPTSRSSSCNYPRDRMRSYLHDFTRSSRSMVNGRIHHSDYVLASGHLVRPNTTANYFVHSPPRRVQPQLQHQQQPSREDRNCLPSSRSRPRRSRDRQRRETEGQRVYTVRL